MNDQLPILSCDGCGACCLYSVTPPFRDDARDAARWRAAPETARDAAGGTGDDDAPAGPCAWLDATTRQCRWYAYRPEACRELELGGELCRGVREREGVDSSAAQRGQASAVKSSGSSQTRQR